MKKIAIVFILLLSIGNFTTAENFRSFTPHDLAMNKPIAKKPLGAVCEFRFTNSNASIANALYIEFNADAEIENAGQFSVTELLLQNGKVWKLSGADIQSLEKVRIVVSTTKKAIKANKWWWLNDGGMVGAAQGKLEAASLSPKLPMPNTANVRDDVFSQKGLALIIGVPRPDKKKEFAWVELRTSADILKSLIEKDDEHFAQPRGLSRLANGMDMKGMYKKLPPSMQNNRLFANIVALKFNILASELGVTPFGFADLVYNESTSTYHGKSVRQIAAHADSLMTYWRGVLKVDYNALDAVVTKINSAFNGPIDTISYSKKLCLTGFTGDSTVFLSASPNGTPKTSASSENHTISSNTPEVSKLNQNYPNPFNPLTVISFTITTKSNVTLKVFNLLGQEVGTLLNNEVVDEGTREVAFDGSNLSSGTYIYRITAENKQDGYSYHETLRMALLK